MTDQRPQYGEIATVEEQRIAAGLPAIEVVEPVAPVPSVEKAPDQEPARSRSIDKFVTVALLAFGVVSVINNGLAYLNFAAPMNETMKILGIEGEFTNFAEGKLWGTIAAFVLVVGWSVTAMLSIRRMRRGKKTWWVPLVGAVVTLFIASICATVPLMTDPAFVEFISQSTAQ